MFGAYRGWKVRVCALVVLIGIVTGLLANCAVNSPVGQGNDVSVQPADDEVSGSAQTPNPSIPVPDSMGVANEQQRVDSAVESELLTEGKSLAILQLDLVPVGTDDQKSAQIRGALDDLLSTLPEGSYATVGDVGTVPVVAIQLTTESFLRIRTDQSVSVVSANREFSVAEEKTSSSDISAAVAALSTTTMQANLAWAAGVRGSGATIAVVDTGVESDHPFLKIGSTKKTIAEGCFASTCGMSVTSAPVPGSAAPCSFRCDHGTHVAGIAVGGDGTVDAPENASGVAPSASLVAVRVFRSTMGNPVTTDLEISNALQWLHNRKETDFPNLVAVNLSVGGSTPSAGYCDWDPLKPFIDQLRYDGVITVIAAGNEGWSNSVSSPGCISSAFTVGAVSGSPDALTNYSNGGPQIDLLSPGTNICSSVPLGSSGVSCGSTAVNSSYKLESDSGTSMATPAVAGAVALLASSNIPFGDRELRLKRIPINEMCVQAGSNWRPSLRIGVALGIAPESGLSCGPSGPGSPWGVLDTADVSPGAVTLSGWAIDSESPSPVAMHAYLDGGFVSATPAASFRPDVGSVYPQYGPNHGFSVAVSAGSGVHSVCIAAINSGPGSNVWLGCRSVTVPGGSPFGAVDVVAGRVGGVDVAGWVIDPDTASPAQAHLYAFRGDGSVAGATSVTAGNYRPDLAVAFPGYGPNHGMSGSLSLPGGTYTVCVAAINVSGSGSNQWMPCRSMTVPGGSPFGAVDVVAGRVGGVDVAGWVIDPDTASPAQAHLYAFRGDGSVAGATSVTAGNYRPDLAVAFPGYGPNHGMSGSLSLPGGTYTVCVAAINVSGSGSNQWMPCRSTTVT